MLVVQVPWLFINKIINKSLFKKKTAFSLSLLFIIVQPYDELRLNYSFNQKHTKDSLIHEYKEIMWPDSFIYKEK